MTTQTSTQALIAAATRLTSAKNEFKPGDVVVWREDMQNKNHPEAGQPAVVTIAHEKPVYNHSSDVSGSPYFHEPLDIAVGVLASINDSTILEYQQDSRRFRLATQEDIDAWDKKVADEAKAD